MLPVSLSAVGTLLKRGYSDCGRYLGISNSGLDCCVGRLDNDCWESPEPGERK